MMDFNSFDLNNNTKEQSIQQSYSNDTENYDQDASDFFAFIDSTNFHSAATGLDQHNHQQPPSSIENQLQSTHDAQSSTHIMSNPSSQSNDTQTPIGNNNSGYPLMSPMHMNVNEYQTPLQQPMVTGYPEDEEFFTPLISPAIPPNYYTNLRSDTNFSPLTSPALGPQQHASVNHHHHHHHQQQAHSNNYFSTNNSMNTSNPSQDGQSSKELQERLAMIERQQQQLRSHMQQSSSSSSSSSTSIISSPAIAVTVSPLSSSSSPVHKSTSAYGNSLSVNASVTKPKQQTLRHKIAMSSPQFNPTTHIQSPRMYPSHHNHQTPTGSSSSIGYQNTHTTISPATPSLLMKLGNGMHHNVNTTNSSTSSSSSNNNSPAILPMTSSHDPIIDNMMSLPDAMLPPSSNVTSKKKITKKATISTSSSSSSSTAKKRRISYPRSAFTPPALLPNASSSYQHADTNHHDMTTFDQGIAALVSPAALRPAMMSPNGGGNGALTSSPRALKPLISPSLQPNGKRLSVIDEHEAATILASKSNYQALREGRAKSLGIDFNTSIQSGMENRRSAHKAAEQRRRDTLKQNFDALRMELLDALIREDELQRLDDAEEAENGNGNDKVAVAVADVGTTTGEGVVLSTEEEEEEEEGKQTLVSSRSEREKKVKQMSKVVLLQHSYEYMLRLKSENQAKDAKLDQMTMEIRHLRTQCGMAPITEEERQAEADEKRLEKEKRLARLKRLEDMVDT